MRTLRRTLPSLVALITLQVSLMGAASHCLHHEAAADSAAAGHGDCEEAAEKSEHAADDRERCPMMATCTASVVQLAAPGLSSAPLEVAEQTESFALEPPTRSTAPELPPPRV